MLGYHRRQRSLISIKEVDKLGKAERDTWAVQEIATDTPTEEGDEQASTPRQTRRLAMVYLLFLAEAIMASSLSAQIAVLAPSATGCMTMNSAFLRSIFECTYFAGSATGVAWGCASDRWGRRTVALCGLAGMTVCCVSMGFATSFVAFAGLRFTAGLGTVVARLPLVTLCGSLGPFAASIVRRVSEGHGFELLEIYPGLSGQLACASMVGIIALADVLLLEETLPGSTSEPPIRDGRDDCEKAALLSRSASSDSEYPPEITLIEALRDDASTGSSPRISVVQLLAAPSVLVLLASFSALSLHSSAFEIFLPHISHTPSHSGGLGLPCSWLSMIKFAIGLCAAFWIARFVPRVIERVGLLKMYRRMSWAFLVLYLVTPLAGLVVSFTGVAPVAAGVVSVLAMLVKATVGGAAQVLAVLLIVSAAPDARSTGSTVSILSIAELFKALAVGISG
ncbi:hypothetical protein LTR53_003991 [Teratosphaeriaceae sp. CCFEE 6253]|nr:hypothetical protein LTR53_003991 [Teratosphaeriaceae sp. CCFEE 6253]